MSRKKKWEADKRKGRIPPAKSIRAQGGNVNKKEFNDMVTWLYQWARDMHEWGENVRIDMVRLEGAVGFAAGDPGDPPDGPPPANGGGNEDMEP